MFSGRSMIVSLLFMACVLVSASAMAGSRGASATFATPARSGAVRFVAVKRVVQFNGYQENMTIAGRKYPGVMYVFRDGSGRVGFAWYYSSDYAQAGQAILSRLPDGSYSGPMDFMNHQGVVTESGTMTVRVVF